MGLQSLIMLTVEEVVNNCIFVYKMDLCLPYHNDDFYLKEELS